MRTLLLLAALLIPATLSAQMAPGVITGRLLTREGQPAVGVRVSAMAIPDASVPVSNATTLVSVVLTDSSGGYRLENVPPGRYYVMAGLVDMPTYYPGVSALSGATAVTVSATPPVTGIDFSMVIPVGVTVSGRVIRPQNQTMPGLQRVALAGSSPIQETTLKADGTFEFARVRPGNYNLVVASATLAQPISVVVVDRDVTGIEAVVVPLVEVLGTIVVEGNGLRPRLSLSFSPYRGGPNTPNAGMSANGTFRVMLPEGDYRLGWSSLPPGYHLKSIEVNSLDLLANPLKVAAGTPVPPIAVTLGVTSPPPWVKLSGRVIGGGGVLAGTAVRLSLSGGLVLDALNVPINLDGTFEIPRVLPGTYTANVLTAPAPPTSIVVPSGKDLTGVEIVIPPVRQVTGRYVIEGTSTLTVTVNFAVQ